MCCVLVTIMLVVVGSMCWWQVGRILIWNKCEKRGFISWGNRLPDGHICRHVIIT
ncbi:hypothetical protein HanIR_Chr16g0822571 [Helianthus annuus]|nr:hypothetical protein HanIR_Chr16g0822571 [Helianthus annuus]